MTSATYYPGFPKTLDDTELELQCGSQGTRCLSWPSLKSHFNKYRILAFAGFQVVELKKNE